VFLEDVRSLSESEIVLGRQLAFEGVDGFDQRAIRLVAIEYYARSGYRSAGWPRLQRSTIFNCLAHSAGSLLLGTGQGVDLGARNNTLIPSMHPTFRDRCNPT
jgi:hypothetical protein